MSLQAFKPPVAKLPPLPWHGTCQCRQLSYEIKAIPITLYACHCTECRLQAASVHGLSLRMLKGDVEFSGKHHVWPRKTDAGNTTNCHFCPDCGVRLWHETADHTGKAGLSVKGGTLDNIGLLEPVGHIWVRSKLPFVRLGENTLCFEADPGPKGYQQLADAFAKRYGDLFKV